MRDDEHHYGGGEPYWRENEGQSDEGPQYEGHDARRAGGHEEPVGTSAHGVSRGRHALEDWPTERAQPQFVTSRFSEDLEWENNDEVGIASEEPAAEYTLAGRPPGRRSTRRRRARQEQKRRRRRLLAGLLAGVLVLLCVGGYLGARHFGAFKSSPPDYSGSGESDIVVQVHKGDTTTDIANTLKQADVVASQAAFLDSARGDSDMATIQPGYYKMRTQIPADDAVKRLTGGSRVGALIIPDGLQLADVTTVGGHVTKGILSLISAASCVDLNGAHHCVTVPQLRGVLQNAAPASLGVPQWALPYVDKVPDRQRRFEGLIKAGSWNIDPGASPEQMLQHLFTASAQSFNSDGLPQAGAETGLGPYQTLVAASLIEREAHPADYGKVARVIVNRLKVGQRLQFDSTVNYPLDRQAVATSDHDRATPTPWNTYAMKGLPETPISAPGTDALEAMEHPTPGNWLYFVTVDKQGRTLFTDDYQQHLANIKLAQQAGVLDGGR